MQKPGYSNAHWDVFDTWQSFVDRAENGQDSMPGETRVSRHGSKYYNGVDSFDEAVHLARHGWADGLERMNTVVAKLTADLPTNSLRLDPQLSNVKYKGRGRLVMSRYINQQPRPYVIRKPNFEAKVKKTGKIVSILFNASSSGGVATETLFAKGALICQLVYLLERAGKRVEIKTAMASGIRPSLMATIVTVKKPEERLDMENLAMALAHAASFRCLAFSVWEQGPPDIRRQCNIDSSQMYGLPTDIAPSDIGQSDASTIVIDASSLYEAEKVIFQKEWLTQTLASQGIEVEF